jgi:hypothetical protein
MITVILKLFFTLMLLGVALAGRASAASASSQDVYARSIVQLGGLIVDPTLFPQTVEGFQAYLTKTGVKAITAADFTRPNHPEIAGPLGFRNFLPPRSWWPRGAALALILQAIETVIKVPLSFRNWWRPPAYNSDPGIGGAKNGDHPTANAVDLDYDTVADRMRAERFLRMLDRKCPWMHLSLGLGALTTHIGIGSPRGHREWHYFGWQPATGRSPKG